MDKVPCKLASASDSAVRLLIGFLLALMSSLCPITTGLIPVPVDVILDSLPRRDLFFDWAEVVGRFRDAPAALGGRVVSPGGIWFLWSMRWAMLSRTFLL